MIRYASAGGYVFGITMLRGGGQEAAQDVELQQAAASFRILPATTPTPPAVPVASVSPTSPTHDSAPAKATPRTQSANASPAGKSNQPAAPAEENSNAKLIWACVAGVIVLLTFASIITRNPAQKG